MNAYPQNDPGESEPLKRLLEFIELSNEELSFEEVHAELGEIGYNLPAFHHRIEALGQTQSKEAGVHETRNTDLGLVSHWLKSLYSGGLGTYAIHDGTGQKQPDCPRFFQLVYPQPSEQAPPQFSQVSNEAAFCELTAGLCQRGYNYETVICPNHYLPAEGFRFLREGDLLVMTAPPPPTDGFAPNNDLENAVLVALKRFFTYLSGSRIELSGEIAERLKKEMRQLLPESPDAMAVINFQAEGKALIQSTQVMTEGHSRDLVPPKEFNAFGYFLHTKQIPGFPCGLILSFGMGRYGNLLWNRLVRLRFDKWLGRPVFAVALLNLPEEPIQPLTPAIADGAYVKVLIEQWLDEDRQAPRRPKPTK